MRATDTFVLSIGGIDPSAGAGVFSDIKTFEHLALNGLAVSTCLTYQSHEKLHGIKWFSIGEIQRQLQPLFSSYRISVCKIALVKDWEMLNQIVDFILSEHPETKIVLDPVLISSSGYEICAVPSESLRKEVMQKLFLVTPNNTEFHALGLDLNAPQQDCLIYYKSVEGKEVGTDALIDKNGEKTYFTLNQFGSEKHGSGCVYSAAIAGYLTMNEKIETACAMAKNVIEQYLTSSTNLIGTLNT